MMHSHSEPDSTFDGSEEVLILVVMDDALAPSMKCSPCSKTTVLILVVMDDALALRRAKGVLARINRS